MDALVLAHDDGFLLKKRDGCTASRGRLARPVQVFISYAHRDEAHRKRLDVHLAPLRREGLVAPWHDRMIEAGTDGAGAINHHLAEADVVLLLVNPDFIASDYCYETELRLALEPLALAWCSSAPVLAVATSDGNIALWDAAAGRPGPELPFAANYRSCLAWSRRKKRFAWAASDGTVKVCDLQSLGRYRRTGEPAHDSGSVWVADPSP